MINRICREGYRGFSRHLFGKVFKALLKHQDFRLNQMRELNGITFTHLQDGRTEAVPSLYTS